MPLRNLFIIAITIVASVACYSVAARNRYANIFAEATGVIEDRALQSVDRRELFNSAMQGMVESLDRHSRFLTGDELRDFRAEIKQEFGGLGVFIGPADSGKGLVIFASFPGSPGMKAGLQPGDRVVAVDGQDITNMPYDEAVRLVKGEVDSEVILSVQRDQQTLDIAVTRQTISVPGVRGDAWNPDGSWDFMLDDHPEIAYIRLLEFGEHSSDQFAAALEQIADHARAVVIDVRGNSGGLLNAAVEICDMLLPTGQAIVSIKSRQGELYEQRYTSKQQPSLSPSIPLVVLIDGKSASASEILAGCLQDNGRATLIGQTTWGKGTVQNILPIERGESALKLTTSSYWRPSEKNIDRDFASASKLDSWGIQPDPDFAVELSDRQAEINLIRRSDHELRLLSGGHLTDLSEFESPAEPSEKEHSELNAKLKTFDPDEPSTGDPSTPHVDQPLQRAIEFLNAKLKDQKAA